MRGWVGRKEWKRTLSISEKRQGQGFEENLVVVSATEQAARNGGIHGYKDPRYIEIPDDTGSHYVKFTGRCPFWAAISDPNNRSLHWPRAT